MVTIAVDAMGGDHAPKAEVEGAIRAARALGVKVILVGTAGRCSKKNWSSTTGARDLPIEIRHASECVTMEDSAAKAVRTKRDSSIRVASRLVREGVAHGVVSAGNTGAVMATAKMVQGMVPGVDRPALASAFPTLKGTPVVVVDVGANVDCSARMLAQFAVMGEIYSRVIFHNPQPARRPALHRRRRAQRQRADPRRHAAAEIASHQLHRQRGRPRHLYRRHRRHRLRWLHRQRRAEGERRPGGHDQANAARIAEEPPSSRKDRLRCSRASAFTDFKKRVDYSEYGGAPLLGVKGVCIITHGRSNANAIKNAIRVAAEFAEGKINERIEEELGRWTESRPVPAAANVKRVRFVAVLLFWRRSAAAYARRRSGPVDAHPRRPSPRPRRPRPRQSSPPNIEPGWHLYSLTTPPGGPIPTTIKLADNPAVAGFRVLPAQAGTQVRPQLQIDTETYSADTTFLPRRRAEEGRGRRSASSSPPALAIRSATTSSACRPRRKTAYRNAHRSIPPPRRRPSSIPAGYTTSGAAPAASTASGASPVRAGVAPQSFGLVPADRLRLRPRRHLHALRLPDDPVHGVVLPEPARRTAGAKASCKRRVLPRDHRPVHRPRAC